MRPEGRKWEVCAEAKEAACFKDKRQGSSEERNIVVQILVSKFHTELTLVMIRKYSRVGY
jgi:hypothetical protein